jgi:hypothetical protein
MQQPCPKGEKPVPDLSDYVVAGGGTAGCILAARLSEDPTIRVTSLSHDTCVNALNSFDQKSKVIRRYIHIQVAMSNGIAN